MVRNRIGSYLRANTLLIDIGSTKAEICEVMGDLPISIQAMGGHPMCGKERSGIEVADPDHGVQNSHLSSLIRLCGHMGARSADLAGCRITPRKSASPTA